MVMFSIFQWNLSPQCADAELLRGSDIFDVWFESGLSWRAVLPENRKLVHIGSLIVWNISRRR